MKTLGLIFPDQLSEKNPIIQLSKENYEVLFFEPLDVFFDHNHHKQKLVFLFSSMRHFYKDFNAKNLHYISITKGKKNGMSNILEDFIAKQKINILEIIQPNDHKTLTQLTLLASKLNIELIIHKDPKFICSIDEFNAWADNRKSLILEYFYRSIRKKNGILMDGSVPLEGKWNFDSMNRNSIKKLTEVPEERLTFKTDDLSIEVMVDVEKIFPKNVGKLDNFNWAVTHRDAKKSFIHFLEKHFKLYGDFQDAIDKNDPKLFHSLCSPYFNAGLLNPMECILLAEDYYRDHKKNIPINAVEGLVRQIIGWREFIYGVYWRNMPEYKSLNYWNHKNRLKDCWYDGTTGIPPLDDAISQSHDLAYTHHINRLMIISNMMNLCRVDPSHMYEWFMEMYIDSADWVMVPNVYGMGTFADGGIFSTKPYICGSSYMLKMSNYKKDVWCDIVDGLYWKFISDNEEFFKSNPRLGLMVNALKKIKEDRKTRIFKEAEGFIGLVTK